MSSAEPVELLEWDSDFWGITIGRVTGDVLTAERAGAADACAREHDVECLYFLARADDARTLEVAPETGFKLMDVRVELTRPLGDSRGVAAVRPHLASDMSELRAIARASHANTRFFADPHFPDERCRDFYAAWIEKSCAGWADEVLVAEWEGRAAGYVTCHLDEGGQNRAASIGLIGVAAGNRERGLGGELVSGACAWALARNATVLSVVTQGGNVPAQRLFQRAGFRTRTVGLWFHKWYPV
jgi:dTDP-4-amino-4,6-dideoxy-D-galactose acyltransferase